MIASTGRVFSIRNGFWAAVLGASAIASVSAGAIAAMVTQTIILSWHWTTAKFRHRWLMLFICFVIFYIIIDVFSNRTPFHVIVSYLTFSENTGYSRIMIAEWGFAEVYRHPVFGIGLNDWVRPEWKSSSFDNFWLLIAVKSGLPAFIFLAAAVWLLMYRAGRADLSTQEEADCRTGYLVSMFGWIIAGCTVHFWNASYCLLMFMLGSGFWITEIKPLTASPRGSANKIRMVKSGARSMISERVA
jgi:hypothetical protein